MNEQKAFEQKKTIFAEDNLQAQAIEKQGSLLTIDIGSINTRTAFFDLVEGKYRFFASGIGPTTFSPPIANVSEGVKIALEGLKTISGRKIMGSDNSYIIPSQPNGTGADFMATTISAGAPLKVISAGLLENVSLTSVLNLTNTTYTNVVDKIGVNDYRTIDEKINSIINHLPDIIIVAGGTNGGATQSVLNLVNIIHMAVTVLPKNLRPEIIYAGNSQLAEVVEKLFSSLTEVYITENIRPRLSTENLGPALGVFSSIFRRKHSIKTVGIQEINTWSGGNLSPTANSFGRVIQFFSKVIPHSNTKGVLGIDIGATNTTVAASFNGNLKLNVISDLGMGEGLKNVLQTSKIEEILKWIPILLSKEKVVDYIQNKIIYPRSVPATEQDLIIEHALAKEVIRKAISLSKPRFPKNVSRLSAYMLPYFDPIIISGAVITNAPSPLKSLRIILDAIQPAGIHQIIVDKNNILSGLGAAASTHPTLVSQLLMDPIAFLYLGFVIAPINMAKLNTPVLKIRIVYDENDENVITIRKGQLRSIPLSIGQAAKIYIDPLNRTDIGAGVGKSIAKKVIGGPFGVIVDARGRPIELPKNKDTRLSMLGKWENTLR
jgi:hypothetical protein